MFTFKNNLQLGVATASAQIEGGEVGSNWNRYSDLGKILDGSNIKRANDHWNRYEDDIAILEELGIKAYRMSVEWARLEPEQGHFSQEAVQHYRDEIALMQSKGIHVLLTLHHFSHPQWFEDLGAFQKAENVDIFLRFVAFTVRNLGDLVQDYCTLNEPNVFAVNGFLFGEWLNEEKSLQKTLRVMNVFIACHLEAYVMIHRIREEMGFSDTEVSFAHHMRYFTPARDGFMDRRGAKLFHFLFQQGLFEAAAMGRFRFPFKNLRKFPKGRYIDKIAVNYYSRGLVRSFRDTVRIDGPKNDLGWEIYPEGLVACLRACYEKLNLPIIITENGTCDNEDSFRPRFIYDHLKCISASELPVTHYYHWCFLDNFEWKEGETPRFGLVHCDYESQKRTVKKSGYMYKELIQAGGFTDEIYQKYVVDSFYHDGERNVLRGIVPEEDLVNRR